MIYVNKLSLLLVLALLVSGCGEKVLRVEEEAEGKPMVTFAVMGDVPYGLTEEEVDAEEAILKAQIMELNEDDSIEFTVHVGDIKKGATPCDVGVYQTVSEILKANKTPLLIIPGDNEWNDCLKPEEAWRFWESHFMRFDEHWTHNLGMERQAKREENFAFLRKGVLFIGLNLVGGKVHNADVWKSMIEDDVAWVKTQFATQGASASSAVIFMHANPGQNVLGNFIYAKEEYKPFIEFLNVDTSPDFQKPILIIHGDGHKWIEDRPFAKAGERITRVQVTQGGLEAPLKVEVTNDPSEPFKLIRR